MSFNFFGKSCARLSQPDKNFVERNIILESISKGDGQCVGGFYKMSFHL